MIYFMLGLAYVSMSLWFKEKRNWRDFLALLLHIVLWPLMLIGDLLDWGEEAGHET